MDRRSEWEEGMLERSSYWDVDILVQAQSRKKKEIAALEKNIWSRIWNWRKIKRLKREFKTLKYI